MSSICTWFLAFFCRHFSKIIVCPDDVSHVSVQAPSLKVLLYTGTTREKHQQPEDLSVYDIVLASYNIVLYDSPEKQDKVLYRLDLDILISIPSPFSVIVDCQCLWWMCFWWNKSVSDNPLWYSWSDLCKAFEWQRHCFLMLGQLQWLFSLFDLASKLSYSSDYNVVCLRSSTDKSKQVHKIITRHSKLWAHAVTEILPNAVVDEKPACRENVLMLRLSSGWPGGGLRLMKHTMSRAEMQSPRACVPFLLWVSWDIASDV